MTLRGFRGIIVTTNDLEKTKKNKKVGITMINKQNTNEKKTLKKGRRGWVVSAAIVALLGVSAGTVVLNNNQTPDQILTKTGNKDESSKTDDKSDKSDKLTSASEKAAEAVKEALKNPSLITESDTTGVVSGSDLKKAFESKDESKDSKTEDDSKKVELNISPSFEVKDDKGTPEVKQKLPELVVGEKGEPAVQPKLPELVVSEKGEPLVQPKLPELVVSEKGEPLVQPKLPELVVSEKGEPLVQPKLPELVITDKGTPEVQPALPEAKPEKDKVLDKKEDKKEVEVKPTTPTVPENKDQTTGTPTKEEKTLEEKKDKVENNQANLPGDKGQTETGKTTTVVGETTKEEVVKPAVPGKPEVPAKPAEDGKPAVPAQPAVRAQPEVKKVITTRTEVETSVIEPGIQHIPDANLNVGETKVVQEGVAGKTETTYTITIENGVEVSRVATGTQTTPAVDKVIHVGTKTSKEVTRTTKEEVVRTPIHPGTDYVPDENLDAGVEKEVEAGKDGEKLEVYTVTLEDGVETGRTLVSSTQKEAKNRVVHVGTKVAKKNIETVTRENHTVEHKVTSNTNPDLPKGEKKVIQAGKDGSYELVTTVVTTPDGTEVSRDEKRENEVPAVDEIVEIGTGRNIEVSRTSRTVEVNYETEEVKDETLNEGKRVVETKGQKGSYTETTIVYGNGHSSVVKSDEVKPVNEVVRVGTHKVVTETKTRVERKEGANFNIVEETNNKLFNDQRVVKTPGQKGEIIENYKDYYEDGKLVKSELINTETVPAVDEVVEVGTKDRYTYSNEDKVITAKGENRVADPELYEGDETVEDAVNGKETYKVKYINDENQNRTEVSRELINTVPAKQKVVHYGTKKLMSEVIEEETETISHSSRTENDSNLFEGESRTEDGRDGFKRYRKVISVNNKTGERTVKSRELVETKDAVDTITYNGTKKKRVADPTDVVVPTNDDNYDIDGTWKDIKSLGENGLDPNNEDHRSAKYLHDNLSQADKDRVAVDTTDDEAELPRDSGLISVWKASRLSQAELDKLEQIVDNRKLNEHFMELLNEERTRKGLTPATIAADDSELTRVANVRANEMADHGSLRYQGKKEGKHKRPDGSRWSTAYDPEFYKQTNAMTENAAETTTVWDIVSLTNEKALAHYFYTVWKHSPGHYAAMMMGDGYSPANKNVQFRVALGFANHSLTSDNPTNVVAMMEIASMMD